MVYAPTAAYLTELFPPRVRYTGLSVSYHRGTGVIGGFMPLIALSLTASTGNQLAGVAYPVAVAAVSTVVSLVLLRRGRDNRVVRAVWNQLGRPDRADSPEPAPTR
ncbi:hypothetical protein ACWCQP_48930 [Streptomyces chartreusis]